MSLKILLASASPRRKQLLEQLHYSVTQQVADIDETPYPNEQAVDYVLRLAKEKARVVAVHNKDAIVLAADTIISLQGQIVGKPNSYQQACELWNAYAKQAHQVITAVALSYQGKLWTATNISQVTFVEMTPAEMHTYWHSGEPQDKAGAYAVQGLAAQWIKEIQGSYSGIMGLPLYECQQLLKQAGLIGE